MCKWHHVRLERNPMQSDCLSRTFRLIVNEDLQWITKRMSEIERRNDKPNGDCYKIIKCQTRQAGSYQNNDACQQFILPLNTYTYIPTHTHTPFQPCEEFSGFFHPDICFCQKSCCVCLPEAARCASTTCPVNVIFSSFCLASSISSWLPRLLSVGYFVVTHLHLHLIVK